MLGLLLFTPAMRMVRTSVCVIGGGQSGINCAYQLKEMKVPYVMVDPKESPGGSWSRYWPSLQLFSPGHFSKLAGDKGFKNNPSFDGFYPSQQDVVDYFTEYEKRNQISCLRPVQVSHCEKDKKKINTYKIYGSSPHESEKVVIECSKIINCTGNIENPFIPTYAGFEHYTGKSIHSADYVSSNEYENKDVLVVGEGNSGAQILAEVAPFARSAIWMTLEEPTFYRDHIDGRILFEQAHQYRRARREGRETPPFRFHSIIMLDSVKKARDAGIYNYRMPPIHSFTTHGVTWKESDGVAKECASNISTMKYNVDNVQSDSFSHNIDAVIWCTGFRPVLSHLHGILNKPIPQNLQANQFQSQEDPNVFFSGYGDWTGFGSGSLTASPFYAEDVVNTISKEQ